MVSLTVKYPFFVVDDFPKPPHNSLNNHLNRYILFAQRCMLNKMLVGISVFLHLMAR